ncbi:MAG TPA: S8 family serine peptidase [Alphaproteobacteria bacterium]|nr:S8 family serine peptidase [Alphaproteobacteria bacterium]
MSHKFLYFIPLYCFYASYCMSDPVDLDNNCSIKARVAFFEDFTKSPEPSYIPPSKGISTRMHTKNIEEPKQQGEEEKSSLNVSFEKEKESDKGKEKEIFSFPLSDEKKDKFAISDNTLVRIEKETRPKKKDMKLHRERMKYEWEGFVGVCKTDKVFDQCPDYLSFLNLRELHKKGFTGKGIKIGVMDSWFHYPEKEKDQKSLSESTFYNAPINRGALIANNKNCKGDKGHHGNLVYDIVHKVVPDSEIRYINFQAEEGIYECKPGISVESYVKGIKRAIDSKVDFLNLSLLFPGENNVNEAPIAKVVKKALLEAANADIGLIVALGNDGTNSAGNANLKSLFKLALNPKMKRRMILVAASEYTDGKERLCSFSNTPMTEEEASVVITAPGGNIAGRGAENVNVVKSGTSFGAPIITGASSLVKQSLGKEAKPEDVFKILLNTARVKTVSESVTFDIPFGQGVVNVKGAVKLIEERFNPQQKPEKKKSPAVGKKRGRFLTRFFKKQL